MQFQADITKRTIDRPMNVESTALGAGMLAGLRTGFWSHAQELQNVRKTDKFFTAKMTHTERSERLNAWKAAVKQALTIL